MFFRYAASPIEHVRAFYSSVWKLIRLLNISLTHISDIMNIFTNEIDFGCHRCGVLAEVRACVTRDAQLVPKIEKLIRIMATSPSIKMLLCYGLRPRLWAPQAWVHPSDNMARPKNKMTLYISWGVVLPNRKSGKLRGSTVPTVNNLIPFVLLFHSYLRIWVGQWWFKGFSKFSFKETKTWSGSGRSAGQAPIHQARLGKFLVPQQGEMSYAMHHHTAKS